MMIEYQFPGIIGPIAIGALVMLLFFGLILLIGMGLSWLERRFLWPNALENAADAAPWIVMGLAVLWMVGALVLEAISRGAR